MRRGLTRAGTLASAAFLLAACGPFGDLFRGRDEPPLPGERISVLTLEDEITADPALAGLEVRLPAPYVNANWPQAGGDPSHAMHHVALPDRISRVWRVSIGAGNSRERRLTASPVVANGVIYAMDTESEVSAFRAADGAQLWRRTVSPRFEERGAIGGGVAFEDGVLFVSTAYGDLMALNAETGALLWAAAIGIPLRGAPTVAAGRAYVLSHDNQLHAVDAVTGEILWNHVGIQEVAGLVGGASAAVAGDTVVAPYTSGEIFALRPENGRVAWSDSLSRTGRLTALAEISDIAGLPVLDRGLALVVGHAGRMAAIDLRSGIRLWELDLASVQSPWVAGDFVFVVTVNAEVIAVSREDGRVRWVQQLSSFENERDREDPIQWSGPVLAGDRLILGSSTGEVVALSPYDGRRLGTLRLSDGISIAPIVADGTLYILTDGAVLHAYR